MQPHETTSDIEPQGVTTGSEAWEYARDTVDQYGADAVFDEVPPPVFLTKPALPPSDAATSVFVVDHFSLSMIDTPRDAGATIRVREISRLDAMRLAHSEGATVASSNLRSINFLEKELQLSDLTRPRLGPGARLLVGETVRWNDIRWFLVEYLSDGDGVVP